MTSGTDTPTALDESRVEAFAARVLDAALGAMQLQAARHGDRLGWYRALADRGSLTSAELAEATGTHERYCREWLEHQAVSAWLEVEPGEGERRYRLPAEHAAVLTDPDSLAHLLPLARLLGATAARSEELQEAYRTGGGVGWGDFGDDAREAQAALNRPMFLRLLAPEYLAAVPGVDAALAAGGRVADVGCGFGWSSVGVARQWPSATVDAFDVDLPSVRAARHNVEAAGVGDRVAVHHADAASAAGGGYDLVMALECVHDMPHPAAVLRAMRRLAGDDGVVVVMDERVADEFTAPGDAVEQMYYGFSLLCCLPDGMSAPGSAGTGTVMRRSVLEGYAREAGFSRLEVLPLDNDVFRFYRLHP